MIVSECPYMIGTKGVDENKHEIRRLLRGLFLTPQDRTHYYCDKEEASHAIFHTPLVGPTGDIRNMSQRGTPRRESVTGRRMQFI